MKLIIFFLYAPFVYSDLHTFMTTYTGIRGATTPGTPEFFAVTSLDGQQIDYYDSNDKKLIPRQDWIKEFESEDQWSEDTEIRKDVQQIYRNNIAALMERFRQTKGVHVYQRMYGCEWEDQTGFEHGFDQYGYDGEDFITLDLKKNRYIASTKEANITAHKWNKNRDELIFLQDYYKHVCIDLLKQIVTSRKAVKSRDPEVSLLYNDPSAPVVCHVTGLRTFNVNLTWLKNGKEYQENVEIRETRPNGNGTFHKTAVLNVPRDEWDKDKYICVVNHMGKTIQKILTESKKNTQPDVTNDVLPVVVVVGVGLVISIVVSIIVYKCRTNIREGYRLVRTYIH